MTHHDHTLIATICRFTLAIALALLSSVPGSKLSQAATLAGFWSFDENSGTTAFDSSVNGFNGTLMSNAALPSWTSGRSGDASDFALNFPGGSANTGPQVNLGNPVGLQLTGSRSFSLWLKPTTLPTGGARQSPLAKSYSGIGTLNVNTGGTFTLYYGGTTGTPNSGANLTQATPAVAVNGDWIHIAHTRDSAGSTQRFYINGVPQAAGAWTTYNPTDLSTGAWLIGTGYTGAFNGVIDDPALWSGALTEGEVASTYQLDAQSDNALRLMGMNVPELDEMWDIYNGGLGNSGYVDGKLWTHVDNISLDGHVLGQAWSVSTSSATNTYLLLNGINNSGLLLTELAVPEPSSFMLLGLGALGLVRRPRQCREIASNE